MEHRSRSANKRVSAKMAAGKEEIFQAKVGCRRHGKRRKLKMELETLETLETGDEGRGYKVETDERRKEDREGGLDDEHVKGEGSEIFAVCS